MGERKDTGPKRLSELRWTTTGRSTEMSEHIIYKGELAAVIRRRLSSATVPDVPPNPPKYEYLWAKHGQEVPEPVTPLELKFLLMGELPPQEDDE